MTEQQRTDRATLDADLAQEDTEIAKLAKIIADGVVANQVDFGPEDATVKAAIARLQEVAASVPTSPASSTAPTDTTTVAATDTGVPTDPTATP